MREERNQPSPEQAEKLRPYVKSGFLGIVENLTKTMTAPYWWYNSSLPAGSRVVGGGTMCFVHTGKRLLGITAGHIHKAYLAAKQADPALYCQVGAHSFDPERCLIECRDDTRDLAVYSISEIQAAAAHAHVHRPATWPPKIEGAPPILVCGWLWHLAESKNLETHHSFLHFITKLSDSTDRSIIAKVEPSTSIPWGDTSLPMGTNLGGMSGGPVYVLNERGLAVLTLSGIISQYAFETVRATPLTAVDALGNILD
jgi:hypothetical protein